MRKIVWIILALLSLSCESECNETQGVIVQQEIEAPYFEDIIVNSGVELIIKQENTQEIIVETGENRLDNVHVFVNNGVLELEADESCFLNPSFDPVKVYISCPNIKSIRNSSGHTISSQGILGFPEFQLLTENNQNTYNNIGDFDLVVDNDKVSIISNGMSIIKISGSTNTLRLSYFGGIGRFEGIDLVAQDIYLFHRGENNLKINPQNSITGDLYATGDVISYNHPPIVEVVEHFSGKLIFE